MNAKLNLHRNTSSAPPLVVQSKTGRRNKKIGEETARMFPRLERFVHLLLQLLVQSLLPNLIRRSRPAPLVAQSL